MLEFLLWIIIICVSIVLIAIAIGAAKIIIQESNITTKKRGKQNGDNGRR